jgi:hypothetical protein
LWQSTPAGPVGRDGSVGAAYSPPAQQPFTRTFRG